MALNLITPPTAYPLSIDEVRQHLKQDIVDDDNLIAIFLGSAVEFAQAATNRQLVAARYVLALDEFPIQNYAGSRSAFEAQSIGIRIPLAPLIQIVSIQYTDMAGATQTLPSTDYVVNHGQLWPEITPALNKTWPYALSLPGSVKVTFDAGYVAPFTADPAANTINIDGFKPLIVGDSVRMSNSGGILPTPLKEKTDYFIQSVVSAGVYTLAASSGGSVIDITDQGIGGINFIGQTGIAGGTGEIPSGIKSWLLLRCSSLDSYRGEVANTRGNIASLPWVDAMLQPYQVVLM